MKKKNLFKCLDGLKGKVNKHFFIRSAICLIVLAILAVAANLGISAMIPKIIYDGVDLPSGIVEKGEERSVSGGKAGALTYGPYVTLGAGKHTVKVYYKTDTDTNKICSYSTSVGTFYKPTTLPADKTVYEFELSFDAETKGVEIKISYSGEGSLSVEKIEFISQRDELNAARKWVNISIAVIFVALIVMNLFWEEIKGKIKAKFSRIKKPKVDKKFLVHTLTFVIWLIVLAIGINVGIPMLNPKKVYDGVDLPSGIVGVGEPRSVTDGEKGSLTYGPYVTLEKGNHLVKVFYKTDTQSNTISCYSTSVGTFLERTFLPENKTLYTFNLSFDEETNRVEVNIRYSGSGSLSVKRIEFIYQREDLLFTKNVLNLILIALVFGYFGYALSRIRIKQHDLKKEYTFTWKSRLKKAIPVAMLISFTFCVAGPIGIYLSNIDEFWFSLQQMLPVLLVTFFVSAAVIVGVLSLFPGKIFIPTLAIFFGIGVALYAEGNYLVHDYGLLDGNEIIWNDFSQWAATDTIIWLAIIFAALLIALLSISLADKIIKYGSIFITVVQAVALAITIVTTPGVAGKTDYLLTTKNMSTVSSGDNIIIFLLDAFDSSFMTDFLEENPAYKDSLEGFTYYPNTSTYGTYTRIAVPYILSGVVDRTEVSRGNYLKLAYQYAPLYQALDDHNYDAGVYTETDFVSYTDPDRDLSSLVTNVYEGVPHIASQTEFLKIWMELTGFRYLPHIFKANFALYSGAFDEMKSGENGKESYNMASPDSYTPLKEPLQFEPGKNAFRFYHFGGIHAASVYLNSRGEAVGERQTNLTEHIKGLFYIINNYVRQMKDADVFDNSTIIIMADHGIAEPKGVPGNPTLIIKPPNSHGDFSVSNAPITYADLLPTLMDILGEDGSKYGRSIFDIGEDEQRTRYCFRSLEWDGKACIVECRIDGDARDLDSWVQIGPALDQLPIEVETVGAFEESSQIYTVLLSNDVTRHYQLTERPGDDLQVELTLYSLTDQASHMIAYADGVEVFNGSVDPSGNVSFALPESVFADDVVELHFEFPEESGKAANLIALRFEA